MAITNISTGFPAFHSVYNPVVYVFDSSNKNQPGFRYVVEVFRAGTSTKLGEFRVAPRPVDGYGYIDLSKFLSTLVTQDFTPTSTTSTAAPNSFISYDVKIGEEFKISWTFADTTFRPGGRTLLGPLTGVSGVGPIHPFQVGDQIFVECANPSLFPAVNGLHTVFAVPTIYSVELDIPFTSTPTNNGTVTYADNRLTKNLNLFAYTNRVAFNGSIDWKSWPTYDPAVFQINTPSTTNKLLTDLPENFKATSTQDLWFNVATAGSTLASRIYFENDSGNLYWKTLSNSPSVYIHQFSAGPNNTGTLTQVVGSTAPLITPSTNWYDFWVAGIQGPNDIQLTRKYRVYLDWRCKIEPWEILFLDRMGSLASYSFNLRSEEAGSIARETYMQQIGNLVGNKWNYSLQDAGEVTTEVSVSRSFNLRTLWMTHEMNVYFEQLLSSPFTFLKHNGVYIPCVVQENRFEIQSSTLKKLISRSVTIKLSNENIVNV